MTSVRISAIIFLIGGTLVNFWHLVSLEMASRYDPLANHMQDYHVGLSSAVMYESAITTIAAIAFVLGRRKPDARS